MDLFFILFIGLFSLILSYLSHKYRYWERRGVPQAKINILFGTLFQLDSIHKSKLLSNVYQQFRGKAKVAGTYVYTLPIAVILDLDVIKSVLIKDFNNFTDRVKITNKGPLDSQIFFDTGERWRSLRAKFTTIFTSAKMKAMLPIVLGVAKQLDDAIQTHLNKTPTEAIDFQDLMGRLTTDIIGNCAFGVECNSLQDPNVKFRDLGRMVFFSKFISIRWRLFQLTYPGLFKLFNVKVFSKEVEEFVLRLVRDTVHLRETQNIKRNDFLNLLIEMKNTKDENGVPLITFEEMAAQVFVFFLAGYETTSSNLSFGLYELAKHPHIQEKLRAEILHVLAKYNGELTYEALLEMTYLDNVINEIVRMYPPLAAITRIPLNDYQIPGTQITLEKGKQVFIPVKEIHYDPDIYDNPNEFRPERFNREEIQKRHPQAFLGFGDGPRNCIGLRFSRMQGRVGYITLLKSYRISLAPQTPQQLEIGKLHAVLVANTKILLKVEKL